MGFVKTGGVNEKNRAATTQPIKLMYCKDTKPFETTK